MERVREAIRIATVFAPGRQIRPVWFDWRSRKHTIQEVCYSWRSRQGEALLLHFAVRTEEALCELVYNTGAQSWTIDAIEVA